MIEEIEKLAKNIFLAQVPRRTAELLKIFVLIKKPKIILELGTSAGYSALFLASGNGKVYTIEKDKRKLELSKKFLKKDNIIQLEGDISEVLMDWKEKIDLLFIDADKKKYLKYLKILEPFLNDNVLIIADNATSHKELMQDYIDYVNENYNRYLLDIDNGLMISVKSTKIYKNTTKI